MASLRFNWLNKGIFHIDSLPGCDQVAVSHSVFLFPRFRGKGHGKQFSSHRRDVTRQLGFDYVLCTVAEDNEAQLATMGEDWIELGSFYSKKTSRVVLLFGMEIN
jgi:GNAT superfamily N-acetyltransferase